MSPTSVSSMIPPEQSKLEGILCSNPSFVVWQFKTRDISAGSGSRWSWGAQLDPSTTHCCPGSWKYQEEKDKCPPDKIYSLFLLYYLLFIALLKHQMAESSARKTQREWMKWLLVHKARTNQSFPLQTKANQVLIYTCPLSWSPPSTWIPKAPAVSGLNAAFNLGPCKQLTQRAC